MFTITKEFEWDCAHILHNHKGECSNLHGHRYKMLVTLSRDDLIREEGSSYRMVCDFGDVAKYVKEYIINKIDHSFVVPQTEFLEKGTLEHDIYKTLVEHKAKVYELLDTRTTAESMARNFYYRIRELMEDNYPNVKVHRVTVYETPTSYATFEL